MTVPSGKACQIDAESGTCYISARLWFWKLPGGIPVALASPRTKMMIKMMMCELRAIYVPLCDHTKGIVISHKPPVAQARIQVHSHIEADPSPRVSLPVKPPQNTYLEPLRVYVS
jgi:hypothetical protein